MGSIINCPTPSPERECQTTRGPKCTLSTTSSGYFTRPSCADFVHCVARPCQMPPENGKGIRQNLGRKAQSLGISGENDEFIWHVLQIKTVVGRDPESCNPNVPRSELYSPLIFPDRILFMSMLNVISWWEKRNEQTRTSNARQVSNSCQQFPPRILLFRRPRV